MRLLILIPLLLAIAAVNVSERRRRAAMTPEERTLEDDELQRW